MTPIATSDATRQDQKMEAVGRLAAGIAHDFNNLLTAILGYGSIVRSSVPSQNVVSGDIDEMLKAAEKARRLTQQLLTFSRKRESRMEPVDLNQIVRGLYGMLRRLVRENVEIDLRLQEGIRSVSIDPLQMEQVILNLIVNACDAMPNGGRLTISTSDRGHDGGVALIVRDNGCGIDDETRARLFEPFFTTKAPGKGTGMGLSLVNDIVQQMMGTVEVDTGPGTGSTFTLRFPASAVAAAVEAGGPQSARALGQGETILLVEDEEVLRHVSARILRSAGYSVIEAVNGDDAIERAARHEGPIDLLVTDVVMPKVGGVELASRLALGHPRMRVIYMSGYSETVIRRQNQLQPEASWMSKPFWPHEFLYEVRTSLDARTSAG